MDRSTMVTPALLAAATFLLLGLPEAWTDGARLRLLGALRPLAESAPKPDAGAAPAAPLPRDREMERLHLNNLDLTQKVTRLTEENAQLRQMVKGLADFRRVAPRGADPLPAAVILAHDPSAWHRTMVIGRGTRDGVAEGDWVVWGAHVVGRVTRAEESVSRVRLITDSGFRLPALVATGDASRAPAERLTGVLEGQGTDTCALNWITLDTRLEAGWPVVTSEDPLSSLPPYLLLGRVSEADPQTGLFLRVRVRPALRFGNLTWVGILTSQPQPPPAQPARRR